MTSNWTATNSKNANQARYRSTQKRAQASIERRPDGSAITKVKSGLFGLGTHLTSHHVAPAPNDEAILGRLDHLVHPPRIDGWKQVDDQATSTVNHYQGRADNLLNSKVDAYITRVGDEATVEGKVGRFGTEFQGHYFAPAPSDQEILQRLSR